MTDLKPDTDRPLENATNDKYGFAAIASKLASGIAAAIGGDGIVIGIEGPWGSGKTTLLNLLEAELKSGSGDGLHVIKIAPWMSGDQTNLVDALLSPIAEALKKTTKQKSRFWSRDNGRDLARLMSGYSVRTGRLLAPVARFAGNFIPGAAVAGEALDVGSDLLARFGNEPTLTELKAQISKALDDAEMNFVVVIDDLDRLDPSQVVEVVRLVRSVADFPRIAYILCYDRAVLSHALQNGLGVPNGDEFLQKIVQLTFAIPLPEPFDLREDFREGALAIYKAVQGAYLVGDDEADFRSAVDREGAGLRTPREVKLALNGLRFTYASLKADVYFPDLCRLNLLKISNPQLYRWIEEYLGMRSVLVTGDARISDSEKDRLGTTLLGLLPVEDLNSLQSIWSLRRFIPGVAKAEKATDRVFATASYGEVRDLIARRRLGSPLHYRFYFALSSPRTVLPDAEFERLLGSARNDKNALSSQLLTYGNSRRVSGRTWFEHVLHRLDEGTIKALDIPQCEAFIQCFASVLDKISAANDKGSSSFFSLEQQASYASTDLLLQLRRLDGSAFLSVVDWLAREAASINWLYGYWFRDLLEDNDPNRVQTTAAGLLSNDQKVRVRRLLKERASSSTAKAQIRELPRVSAYLWGWRAVSSEATVRRWVSNFIKADGDFLWLLERLRSWALSDRVYYPLNRSTIEALMSYDAVLTRLGELEGSEKYSVQAKEILHAIKLGRD